jgi:ATP-dependent Clp protease ATP-binding subunit ClpC
VYERFTDRARKVMQLANQEAQRFNHEYIGTEHILLALIKEGSGVAATVLKNLDIDLRTVRLEVEKVVQSGPDRVTLGKLPQTPRAKKVIEYAIEEARTFNHNYVGSEHLLLGLLREEEGVAAQVLMNLGVELAHVREEVLNLLGEDMAREEGGSYRLDRKCVSEKTPTLDNFSFDRTELARQTKLSPLVGRAAEMERFLLVLGCRTRNNPLLLGESGVGKTALVEGLAQRIVRGDVPDALRGCRVVSLNLDLVSAGTNAAVFRGRLKSLLVELRGGNVLLHLNHLNLCDGLAKPFAPLIAAIAHGSIRCIGSATDAGGGRLPRFAALARRFSVLPVAPLGKEETVEVLRGLRKDLEVHHRVQITDPALQAAADLAGRHFGGGLPGTAVRLLDLAGAAVVLHSPVRGPDGGAFDAQLAELNLAKEKAIAEMDFEKAARLRAQEDKLKREREHSLREWRERTGPVYGVVDAGVVARAAARFYAVAQGEAPPDHGGPFIVDGGEPR